MTRTDNDSSRPRPTTAPCPQCEQPICVCHQPIPYQLTPAGWAYPADPPDDHT